MKKDGREKKDEQGAAVSGLDMIEQALDSFNTASESLKKYYGKLEQRVFELDVELEEERKCLNNILQSLPVGVVVLNLNGKVTNLNKYAMQMTGMGLKEAVGKSVREIVTLSSWHFLDNHSSDAYVGDIGLEVDMNRQNEDDLTVLASASFLKDRNSEISGRLVIFQDITELKRLEEQAERNRRLASMGEMAAGIAHEMRNPLGSMELFSSMLRDDLTRLAEAHPEVDEGRELLKLSEHISSGIKTLSSVLTNMLVFATQPKPQFKMVLISDLLNESLKLLSPMVEASFVEVELKSDVCGVTILADEELLGQVFLNVIINALQAMKEQKSGKLTIDISLVGNRFVEISFSDTGIGIPQSVVEKIFAPFFTTKAKGAGLGLSIVNNLMEAHGGAIEVDGNVGQGATIKLRFPQCVEKEMPLDQVVNS